MNQAACRMAHQCNDRNLNEMDGVLDVFFYEAFEEEAAELARCMPADVKAGYTAATIQESGDAHPPAPIVSVRTQSLIPDAWAGRLEALLSRSTGYDHLLAYRRRNGGVPACGYLPLYCARAVAEHAMLMWSALARRLSRQVRQFDAFHRDGLTGRELAGSTLMVVGAGNIGGEIARIGQGLDMTVHAVDPVKKHAFIDYVEYAPNLGRADIIVCAMNLTAANRGYFNYASLENCNPGAIFVNVSRGELSPPDDLLRLLEDGRLGGVGLDVYEDESRLAVALRVNDPMPDATGEDAALRAVLRLRQRDDVICTPHNAFNTAQAVRRKSEQSVQQIVGYLQGKGFVWDVPDA